MTETPLPPLVETMGDVIQLIRSHNHRLDEITASLRDITEVLALVHQRLQVLETAGPPDPQPPA